MTGYNRGDVVLISFVFADETGAKQRPVVIISSGSYNQHRQEVIISAITSNINRLLTGDHLITQWKEAGLLFPSVATGIIRTLKQSMVIRKIGEITPPDLKEIDSQLRICLGLQDKADKRL